MLYVIAVMTSLNCGIDVLCLRGSLPAFFLSVSGCPAPNTAAVRLLW